MLTLLPPPSAHGPAPRSRRLYALTVDTEEQWDWEGPFRTHGHRTDNLGLISQIQDIAEDTAAKATYLVTHAVLADTEARAAVLGLVDRPDVEIGAHLHPWNTPPLVEDPTPPPRTYTHRLPHDLIRAKLNTLHAAFLAQGLRPVSFRGGRYSSGPVVQGWLAQHGYACDLSVVPYTQWSMAGAPHYEQRTLQPQRRPPNGPDQAPLWEVPVGLGFTAEPFDRWARWFQAIEAGPLGRWHAIGLLRRLSVVNRVWLNFEQSSPDEMLEFLDAIRDTGYRHLVFTLHSSSLVPGATPYCPDRAAVERLLESMRIVLGELARWEDFEPATTAQMADQLEREFLDAPGPNPGRDHPQADARAQSDRTPARHWRQSA